MGFTRRIGTTTRPPVLKGLFTVCKRDYLRDIKEFHPELIVNADQTPSSYGLVGKCTMDSCGSKSVPVRLE